MSNIISHESACDRWCPFIRISNSKENGISSKCINRKDDNNYNCLGSGCMAWVFDEYGDGSCALLKRHHLEDYNE
ncbi:MAG: hypothetical protein GY936_19325 [Ignavibacteriae bacterium]|nr:hypothetical protein [Ignavibacteriota bacterium]